MDIKLILLVIFGFSLLGFAYVMTVLLNFSFIKDSYISKTKLFKYIKLKNITIVIIAFIPFSINFIFLLEHLYKKLKEAIKFLKEYIAYDKSIEKIIDKSRE